MLELRAYSIVCSWVCTSGSDEASAFRGSLPGKVEAVYENSLSHTQPFNWDEMVELSLFLVHSCSFLILL